MRIEFESFIAARTRNFSPRPWLFRRIAEWLADPAASRFLLISGEPGSGKTAIAARVCQLSSAAEPEAEEPALRTGSVAAWHFCWAQDAHWLDPVSFSESISTQLGEQIPRFRDAVLAVLGAESRLEVNASFDVEKNWGKLIAVNVSAAVSPGEAFARLVRAPLERLFSEGYDGTLAIVVDGLDEATKASATPNIFKLVSQTRELRNVRFLLTSRPIPAMLEELERQEPDLTHIRLGDPSTRAETLNDVRRYVERVLAAQPAMVGSAAGAMEALIEAISRKAEGNFLWARFAVATLRTAGGGLDLSAIDRLPAGLDSLYAEFLQRVVGDDVARWRNELGPILGLLAVAQEELNEPEISFFTGLPLDVVAQDLAAVGELLDIEGERAAARYSIYHRSFVDFLVDRSASHPFWCDPAVQHRRIVTRWRESIGPDGNWTLSNAYSLRHIARHLYETREDSRSAADLHALVNRRWRELKRDRTGTDASFFTDVQLSVDAARAARPLALVEMVKGSLVLATLAGMGTEIGLPALRLMARLGRAGEALQRTSIMPPGQRSSGYAAIAEALMQAGNAPGALEAAREALTAAKTDEAKEAARVLIVRALAATGGVEDALGLARQLGDASRAQLAELRAAAIEKGLFYEAAALARTRPHRWDRECELLAVIRGAAAAGRVAEPLQWIEELEDQRHRDEAYTALFVHQQMAGSDAAVRALSSIGDRERASAVGSAIARQGASPEVIEACTALLPEGKTRSALFHAAEELASAGDLDRAMKLATSIDDSAIERVEWAFIEHLVARGRGDALESFVAAGAEDGKRLSHAAAARARAGQLAEALAMARGAATAAARDAAIAAIVSGALYDERLDPLALAAEITDPRKRRGLRTELLWWTDDEPQRAERLLAAAESEEERTALAIGLCERAVLAEDIDAADRYAQRVFDSLPANVKGALFLLHLAHRRLDSALQLLGAAANDEETLQLVEVLASSGDSRAVQVALSRETLRPRALARIAAVKAWLLHYEAPDPNKTDYTHPQFIRELARQLAIRRNDHQAVKTAVTNLTLRDEARQAVVQELFELGATETALQVFGSSSARKVALAEWLAFRPEGPEIANRVFARDSASRRMFATMFEGEVKAPDPIEAIAHDVLNLLTGRKYLLQAATEAERLSEMLGRPSPLTIRALAAAGDTARARQLAGCTEPDIRTAEILLFANQPDEALRMLDGLAEAAARSGDAARLVRAYAQLLAPAALAARLAPHAEMLAGRGAVAALCHDGRLDHALVLTRVLDGINYIDLAEELKAEVVDAAQLMRLAAVLSRAWTRDEVMQAAMRLASCQSSVEEVIGIARAELDPAALDDALRAGADALLDLPEARMKVELARASSRGSVLRHALETIFDQTNRPDVLRIALELPQERGVAIDELLAYVIRRGGADVVPDVAAILPAEQQRELARAAGQIAASDPKLAIEIAHRLEGETADRVRRDVARTLAERHDVDTALALADECEDDDGKHDVLFDILRALAKHGEVDRAVNLLATRPAIEGWLVHGLANIARNVEDPARVLDLCNTLAPLPGAVSQIADVAERRLQAGDDATAKQLLDLVLSRGGTAHHDSGTASVFGRICGEIARSGAVDRALEAAAVLAPSRRTATAYRWIAELLAWNGDRKRAAAIAATAFEAAVEARNAERLDIEWIASVYAALGGRRALREIEATLDAATLARLARLPLTGFRRPPRFTRWLWRLQNRGRAERVLRAAKRKSNSSLAWAYVAAAAADLGRRREACRIAEPILAANDSALASAVCIYALAANGDELGREGILRLPRLVERASWTQTYEIARWIATAVVALGDESSFDRIVQVVAGLRRRDAVLWELGESVRDHPKAALALGRALETHAQLLAANDATALTEALLRCGAAARNGDLIDAARRHVSALRPAQRVPVVAAAALALAAGNAVRAPQWIADAESLLDEPAVAPEIRARALAMLAKAAHIRGDITAATHLTGRTLDALANLDRQDWFQTFGMLMDSLAESDAVRFPDVCLAVADVETWWTPDIPATPTVSSPKCPGSPVSS